MLQNNFFFDGFPFFSDPLLILTNKREGILGSLTLQTVVQMSAFPFLPIWDERSCSRSSFNKGLCLVWWLFCFLDMLCSPYNHKWICPGGPAGPTEEKQKQEGTENTLIFSQHFVVPNHPAEFWCRKMYSSRVKKAMMKISWKGMILDWKGGKVQPIWTHKGGNSDSLVNEIQWIVGIPVIQLGVFKKNSKSPEHSTTVRRTYFNLKSRAIWKQRRPILRKGIISKKKWWKLFWMEIVKSHPQ